MQLDRTFSGVGTVFNPIGYSLSEQLILVRDCLVVWINVVATVIVLLVVLLLLGLLIPAVHLLLGRLLLMTLGASLGVGKVVAILGAVHNGPFQRLWFRSTIRVVSKDVRRRVYLLGRRVHTWVHRLLLVRLLLVLHRRLPGRLEV